MLVSVSWEQTVTAVCLIATCIDSVSGKIPKWVNLSTKQVYLQFRFKTYWQGNVCKLPEAIISVICHMKMKQNNTKPKHKIQISEQSFMVIFGHQGIRLQSFGVGADFILFFF